MAWNEPGKNDKDKDPWNTKRNHEQDGPPDLDEALKSLMGKLGLGGSSGRSNRGGSSFTYTGLLFALGLLVITWFIAGFYTVKEAERAVVQRFGAYHSEVTSGLHWRPLGIDAITNVDINNVRAIQASGFVLTEDENVVRVEMTVQYRVSDPKAFLFNVENPEASLAQITDSALRYVIGHNTMDNVLTVGRGEVRQQSWEIIERLIERYELGLNVIDINFQGARPPEQVRHAFDDAIRAQEDEERFIREAEAYAREIEPTARGRVRRMQQEASAYKEQVVLRAQGEIARFELLLPQYQAAPEVTRQRIFLETLEEIYARNAKIFIDTDGSNNLLYLPLDKIFEQRAKQATPAPVTYTSSGQASKTSSPAPAEPVRESRRTSSRGG